MVVAFTLALLLSAASAPAEGLDPEALRSHVTRVLEELDVPGMSIGP